MSITQVQAITDILWEGEIGGKENTIDFSNTITLSKNISTLSALGFYLEFNPYTTKDVDGEIVGEYGNPILIYKEIPIDMINQVIGNIKKLEILITSDIRESDDKAVILADSTTLSLSVVNRNSFFKKIVGITLINTNGTTQYPYVLPPADTNTLGGIIAGKNTSIGKDGVLNVTIDTNTSEGGNISHTVVNADGSLSYEMIPLKDPVLPSDFPTFKITGESIYKGNFYVTPHDSNRDRGYLMILNPKGQLLWYKKTEKGYCHCFRKQVNSKGLNRYVYLETITSEYPTAGNANFYESCELVVMDENFVEIDRVRNRKSTDIVEDYPVENHDYMYIDDGHYIVLSYYKIPGDNFYYNSIQELRFGSLKWEWTTREHHAELQPLSHTSSTGDYAHINSIIEDYDYNYIISFRNIGIVKINKDTKEIMWVLGRLRNDFTGITSANIPYQQHDCQIVKKDGSYTIFDNYGHSSKSRICRFWLDQVAMTATYKEYITTMSKSAYMGSSQLIDDTNEIFDIAYGSAFNIGFEEYDFKNSRQLMKLTFDGGHDLYRIYRDVDDLHTPIYSTTIPDPEVPTVNKVALGQKITQSALYLEDNYTPESWTVFQSALNVANTVYNNADATQEEVDIALSQLNTATTNLVELVVDPEAPTYSIQHQVFDGTNYLNTGVKLFNLNKSFVIILKFAVDLDSYNIDQSYATMFSCLNGDLNGFNGVVMKGYAAKARVPKYDIQTSLASNKSLPMAIDSSESSFIVAYRRNINGSIDLSRYSGDGELIGRASVSNAGSMSDLTSIATADLILGASINTSGTAENFMIGTIYRFNYYEKYMEYTDIDTIVSSMGQTVLDSSQLDINLDIAKGYIEEEYTVESWTPLATAISDGELILNDYTNYTQAEIDDATYNLEVAIDNLVVKDFTPPAPTYQTANEVFDGTRYVDTNQLLFDTDKDFTIFCKYNFDSDAVPNTGDYSTIFHCMHEVTPWKGCTCHFYRMTSTGAFNLAVNLNISVDNLFTKESVNVINYGGVTGNINNLTYLIVFKRDATNNAISISRYNMEGLKLEEIDTSLTYGTVPTELKEQHLYLGANDLINSFGRYFKGTIHNFEYYENSAFTKAQLSQMVKKFFN